MSIAFWPTIQLVSGGAAASPASITRDGQWTIVAVDVTVPDPSSPGGYLQYVELPSGAEVGDVVEIYCQPQSAPPVAYPQTAPPSGETFITGYPVVSGMGMYRKISSTSWGYSI